MKLNIFKQAHTQKYMTESKSISEGPTCDKCNSRNIYTTQKHIFCRKCGYKKILKNSTDNQKEDLK